VRDDLSIAENLYAVNITSNVVERRGEASRVEGS